ncbi:hypothetical protein [Clostridium sp.]|uniref:hypothetical protein n=1 Tax=Clostridium sp. TaxID=1506 RepID=UPI002FCAAA88
MYILTILLIILMLITITFLIIVLFALSLIQTKAFFTFNSEKQFDFNLTIEWSKPIFRCLIGKDNQITFLTVYLFNIRIISKTLTKNYRELLNNIKFLNSLEPKYLKIDAYYGFIDPSITGMICGIISLVSQSAKITELNNNANFISDYDYAKIEAMGVFNSISSIAKVLNLRKKGLVSPTLQGVK